MKLVNFLRKTEKENSRALAVVKSDEKYGAPEIREAKAEIEKTEGKSLKKKALKKDKLKGKKLAKREDTKKVKHGIKGNAKSAGAVLLALTLAVNIAGVLIAERPDDATLSAALTPAYVVEETIDMPPAPTDVLSEEDEEDERKNRKITVSGIAFYILSGAFSMFVGLMKDFVVPAVFTIMSPLMMTILSWVLFAVAIFGAIIIALKTAFPDVPLKELLSKKNIFWITVFIIAVIVFCEVIGYYLKDYMGYIKAGAFIAGLVFVVAEFNHIRDKYFA